MSNSSDTTSYSPQGYSTLPPSKYIMSPQNSPGRNINASVQIARAEPYPSRTPSSPRTSFRRSCVPIEEEEDSTSMEPQGGLFPITPRRNISASMSSPQTGPHLSRTPPSPSTSFIRCLGTLAEEEDEEEEDEWTSMEPQRSLFSGYDISWTLSISHTLIPEHVVHQAFVHTYRRGRRRMSTEKQFKDQRDVDDWYE
ncbi:hypothetical protein CY34DRAFT_106127 [Suillus luteus UH-Slu-Lm8-n1]|uniref:Unplaced genomic scaffold CY34scaffold_66, whole genome shotgun sequence n=1 Tax=Suillus luteus UH-Slu-Lm8-n1 TaxID=930992 RepID=A0A0D0B256_9AGAM|nr:hypothetical protein CY34DRAFT_106127 [Suillus luteus UH-Slu-Lm8-n1]